MGYHSRTSFQKATAPFTDAVSLYTYANLYMWLLILCAWQLLIIMMVFTEFVNQCHRLHVLFYNLLSTLNLYCCFDKCTLKLNTYYRAVSDIIFVYLKWKWTVHVEKDELQACFLIWGAVCIKTQQIVWIYIKHCVFIYTTRDICYIYSMVGRSIADIYNPR